MKTIKYITLGQFNLIFLNPSQKEIDELNEKYMKIKNPMTLKTLEIDFPELIGSEKQISWASEIQQKIIVHLVLNSQEFKNIIDEEPDFENKSAIAKKQNHDNSLKFVLKQTDAAWFIDNKDRLDPFKFNINDFMFRNKL